MKFGRKKIQTKQVDIHEVFVFYPCSFDDVQYAIDTLASDTPLVVSFAKTDDKNMQRFLDFLSGAIYAFGLLISARSFLWDGSVSSHHLLALLSKTTLESDQKCFCIGYVRAWNYSGSVCKSICG